MTAEFCILWIPSPKPSKPCTRLPGRGPHPLPWKDILFSRILWLSTTSLVTSTPDVAEVCGCLFHFCSPLHRRTRNCWPPTFRPPQNLPHLPCTPTPPPHSRLTGEMWIKKKYRVSGKIMSMIGAWGSLNSTHHSVPRPMVNPPLGVQNSGKSSTAT